MTKDQLETWMHNMIRACNRSTYDSDINVLKLIQHIENLYEKGRADEREQAEKQEPVAYKYTDKTNPLVFYFTTHKDSLPNPDVIEAALYTAPNMYTKPENIDTSEKRVHETDKSVHEPWDTSDMAYRAGGLSVEQEPVAWDGNCVLGHCGSPDGCDRSGCCRADTAPPKPEQEPVAWMSQGGDVSRSKKHFEEMGFNFVIPLYTAPFNWVGIAVDEIPSLWGNADADLWLFAQAIEDKLRERNT
jgi:hypothetical protein